MSPSELVEWQTNARGRDAYRIRDLAQQWINGQSWRVSTKQKSMVFWVGLILFCLAALLLFEIVWMTAVVMYPANVIRTQFLKGLVPLIVGGIVFMVIGTYMMKSGSLFLDGDRSVDV